MSVKIDIIKSARWLAIGKLSGQILNWVITIIVIRLLTPVDYGLMASAGIFVGFLSLISELGFSAAIIQSKSIEDKIKQQIFGIVIVVGLVFFLSLFFLSVYIAEFLSDIRLTQIIKVLSFQFLLIPLLTIPKSIIEKEMRFKQKSIIDFIASIVSAILTLIFAIAGYGVWSLIFGSFTVIIVQMIGYNIISPFIKLPLLRFNGMKEFVLFSGYVTLEKMVWYFYTQADVLIVGKMLGQEVLGYYSLAMHLASLIIQKISPLLSQVAFPAYSKIQNDLDLVGSYFLKSVRIISVLVFPVFIGLSSISKEVIIIFIGNNWLQSIIPFKLLCLVMPFRMLGVLVPSPLKAIGKVNINVRNIFLTSTIMISSFYIASSYYGMIGVCYAWLVMYPICLYIMIKTSMRFIRVNLRDYLKAIAVPLSGSIVLFFVVTYIKKIVDVDPSINITVYILSGFIVYASYIYLVGKERFFEIRNATRIS